MEVTAYTAEGEARPEGVTLPESTFDGVVNEDALHQVVTAIRAHARQGTASTRTYDTVAGGSRKPWRQKGTGRARHGTIRSPIWRGGVVTFGPRPRSYDVRVPRKMKQLALRSALNARAAEGDLAIVEPIELEEPRTRSIAKLLEGVGAEGRKVLLLTDGHKPIVHLSARNIPNVRVQPWGEASAYDVLWSALVLVEGSALQKEGAGEGKEG